MQHQSFTKRTCQDCYEQIPAKRLLAIPDARYCVQHQAEYDVFLGSSRLGTALAIGAVFHADDISDLRGGRA